MMRRGSRRGRSGGTACQRGQGSRQRQERHGNEIEKALHYFNT